MASNDKLRYCRNSIMAVILNNIENKLPIKETDIQQILDKDKALLRQCFPLAQAELEKTYGILVKKLPEGRKYICYSDQPAGSVLEYDEHQQRRLTLIFIILSYIYLRDCRVDEERLFEFLHGMHIDVEQSHPYFGDNLKKLITDTFVKELYLKKEPAPSEATGEMSHVYSWGFRSFMEFKEKDMLDLNALLLNKEPSDFVAQFEKIKASKPPEVMEID